MTLDDLRTRLNQIADSDQAHLLNQVARFTPNSEADTEGIEIDDIMFITAEDNPDEWEEAKEYFDDMNYENEGEVETILILTP